MTEIYIPVYRNQYPDDGFELGDAYTDKEEAEVAAANQSDADFGWTNATVRTFEI